MEQQDPKTMTLLQALGFGLSLAAYNHLDKFPTPPSIFPLDIVLLISFFTHRSNQLKTKYKIESKKC